MQVWGVALAATVVCSGCVDRARWRRQKIYQAHVIAGDAYRDRGDPDRALANYNAALKQRDGSDELMDKRRNVGRQIAARELERVRQMEGPSAVRLAVALRGSKPVGIDVPHLVANAIIDRAGAAMWPQIVAMAEHGQFAAAVVAGRMLAAALPKGNRFEAPLRDLGRRGASHHRQLAAQSGRAPVRKFHNDLARMLARPLANLRRNIHETRADRPNQQVRIRSGACPELLAAVERHLGKITDQFAIVRFRFPRCPIRATQKQRRQSYYYWTKVPNGRKQVTTVRWEISGRMGAQSSKCVSRSSGSSRCTNYATTYTGGGYTYRPVKGKKWVAAYKRVRKRGYRMVTYVEHSAAMYGRAQVSVGRSRLTVNLGVRGTSEKGRKHAVDRAAKQIARRIADASLQVAQRVAQQLRRIAAQATSEDMREEQLLAALAVLGRGRDPLLYQRYGVDGAIVQDIFTNKPRWPPIGLPPQFKLPKANTTAIERGIVAGRIDTPISLDEDDNRDHVWLAGTVRSSYLLDTERIHELELGWKKTSMEVTARLGLSAFGGDGSSFDFRNVFRARGQFFGWYWGWYFAIDIGDEPTDPMKERGNFAALGGIIGVQAQWWRFRASAHIAPNTFQIFGTGDESGTSRPSPVMAEAFVQLPLGLFASASAGYYLGFGDSGVWQLSAGWRVSFGDRKPR